MKNKITLLLICITTNIIFAIPEEEPYINRSAKKIEPDNIIQKMYQQWHCQINPDSKTAQYLEKQGCSFTEQQSCLDIFTTMPRCIGFIVCSPCLYCYEKNSCLKKENNSASATQSIQR